MKVRKTEIADLDILMTIYNRARQFMEETGNANQWINGYPSRELLMEDIYKGQSYVCLGEEGELVATFCFFVGDEVTYRTIYEGKWLCDEPYGVVHRLASNGKVKGIADFCMQWCYNQCGNVRVDTHQDNLVMQRILERNSYIRCGVIYAQSGTPRIAYQKCNM